MLKMGIAAHSEIKDKKRVDMALEFVEQFSDCLNRLGLKENTYLLLGGYWGMMKVVIDKALEKGLRVAVLPPCERDSEEFFPPGVLVVRTGLSMRGRSIAIARSSDVLVSLGGSSGTILEIIAAYTEGVPVYILGNTGLPSDKVEVFSPFIDERRSSLITISASPIELVSSVCTYLETVARRKYALGRQL
jgi:uncharacterized protein (TIGR00725 family)